MYPDVFDSSVKIGLWLFIRSVAMHYSHLRATGLQKEVPLVLGIQAGLLGIIYYARSLLS